MILEYPPSGHAHLESNRIQSSEFISHTHTHSHTIHIRRHTEFPIAPHLLCTIKTDEKKLYLWSYTIELHCSDEYTTSPSTLSSFPVSLWLCGEQSSTVFFTLDPRRAIDRISQSGNSSSMEMHNAIKWAWKRRGSPAKRQY